MESRVKAVVVTGSGGNGCGRAIARRFARDGAPVVVSDLQEPGGHESVRQIEAAGGRAVFFKADVRIEDQVRDLARFAETSFGHVGVWVNNASLYRPADPLEHWSDTVQTELFGTMYGTRVAIEALRRGGGGAVVNMSSISGLWHGRTRTVGAPAYDFAKAGIIRLTTTLAWLGDSEHIRVNCLAPGWIGTDEVRSYWESLTPERRRELGVPSRLLPVEEIAGAVMRLATDETLCGRVLVWWSEDSPRLIEWGDPGYARAVEIPLS